jgi:hypothetical protein
MRTEPVDKSERVPEKTYHHVFAATQAGVGWGAFSAQEIDHLYKHRRHGAPEQFKGAPPYYCWCDPEITESGDLVVVTHHIRPSDSQVREELIQLFLWTPEDRATIKRVMQANDTAWGGGWYTAGDEDAPFFSEAGLYALIGKEDARSVLARLHTLVRAMGFDPASIEHEALVRLEKAEQAQRDLLERRRTKAKPKEDWPRA